MIGTHDTYLRALDKIEVIKYNLNQNKELIESNKDSASDSQELLNVHKQILLNKSINNKFSALQDLLQIPAHMITCLRNNCYDQYVEYTQYVEQLSNINSTVKLIKEAVSHLNTAIITLINKLIRQGSNPEIPLEYIQTILKLPQHDVLSQCWDDSVIFKKLNVILYKIEVFYSSFDKNANSNDEDLFIFINRKIEELTEVISGAEQDLHNPLILQTAGFVIDKYFHKFCKTYYFKNMKNDFLQRLSVVSKYILKLIETLETKCTFATSLKELNILEELIFEKNLEYMEHLFSKNLKSIKLYLGRTRDLKKLLLPDSQYSGAVTHEILIVIYNNLTDILDFVSTKELNRTKYKSQVIERVGEHIVSVLETLVFFFEDNMLSIKINELQDIYSKFRHDLINYVMVPVLEDLHYTLGLERYWNTTEKSQKVSLAN